MGSGIETEVALKTLDVAKFYTGQWDLLGPLDSIDLRAREQKLLQLLPEAKDFFANKKVLVAGCAYGWEAFLFYSWGAIVTGVDLYINKTIKFLEYFGVDLKKANIEVLEQNIENLNLPKSQ